MASFLLSNLKMYEYIHVHCVLPHNIFSRYFSVLYMCIEPHFSYVSKHVQYFSHLKWSLTETNIQGVSGGIFHTSWVCSLGEITSMTKYGSIRVWTVTEIAVLCVYYCLYFRCRTAGYKSVLGRSCDRPPRRRFFSVSLCLMLRWFPTFQVATTCFSCSPPDLNLLVTNFIFCIHVK